MILAASKTTPAWEHHSPWSHLVCEFEDNGIAFGFVFPTKTSRPGTELPGPL